MRNKITLKRKHQPQQLQTTMNRDLKGPCNEGH